MNIKTEWLKTSREEVERQAERVKWGMREHRKENDLAVTQVDHYLLLHKCDVVEKVKLIVWKWAESAGLILNHYHHCTMADSSFGFQGVLPWCSLEQIDKLVLRLQREECGMKRLKTYCPLCNCPLSVQAQQQNVCSVSWCSFDLLALQSKHNMWTFHQYFDIWLTRAVLV